MNDLNAKTSAVLAILITLILFASLAMVLRGAANDNPVAQTLLGALGAGWVSVVSYYFGSSAGSKAKDAVIAGRVED